ncbi:hypothetical protein X777_04064, partial [Ooceraea biroi]
MGRFDDNGGPRRAKVTERAEVSPPVPRSCRRESRFHACTCVLVRIPTQTYASSIEYGALESKERHGHSENRQAGQAKKKSYPEWCEDGYSARTGNRRREEEAKGGEKERDGERYCEEQGGKRDLSRSDVEDRTCSTGSSCSTIPGRKRER